MSSDLREALQKELEIEKARPAEEVADSVRDTYPDISLEDAQRIKDGLIAIMTARTRADLRRHGRAYKALHAELKRKYK